MYVVIYVLEIAIVWSKIPYPWHHHNGIASNDRLMGNRHKYSLHQEKILDFVKGGWRVLPPEGTYRGTDRKGSGSLIGL